MIENKKKKSILLGIVIVIFVVIITFLTFMQDRTAPQIYLPNESIVYEKGDTIEKLLEGCVAIDNNDGDISEKIQIASAVIVDDGTKLKITYIVYDGNKNVDVATRMIDYAGGDMSVFEIGLAESTSNSELESEENEESISDSNVNDMESNTFQTEDGVHEHAYEEIAKQEATILEAGFVTYQCVCGDSYTEELEKLRLTVPVLQELRVDAGNMIVSWEAVPGATGYVIYRLGDNNQWMDLNTVESETSYIDRTVETGKTYTYTVKAYVKTDTGIIWGSYNRIGVTKTVE